MTGFAARNRKHTTMLAELGWGPCGHPPLIATAARKWYT